MRKHLRLLYKIVMQRLQSCKLWDRSMKKEGCWMEVIFLARPNANTSTDTHRSFLAGPKSYKSHLFSFFHFSNFEHLQWMDGMQWLQTTYDNTTTTPTLSAAARLHLFEWRWIKWRWFYVEKQNAQRSTILIICHSLRSVTVCWRHHDSFSTTSREGK